MAVDRILALVVSALALSTAGWAQYPTVPFWLAERRGRTPEWTPEIFRSADGTRPLYRPGYQGFPQVFRSIPSYPTLPGGLSPKMPTGLDELSAGWQPTPLPEGTERTWPSWMAPGLPEEERSPSPDRVILARTADRVWFLERDEPAFVPLAFYDKFRVMRKGSAVEVRHKGEFEMVFHDGGVLVAYGPTRIGVLDLNAGSAELEIRVFRNLWLEANSRPVRLVLPDGSEVIAERAEVYLETEGGRAQICNNGPSPVRWLSRVGELALQPSHRVQVLVAPPTHRYLAPELQVAGDVQLERQGRKLEVRGSGDGGVITWSGTRVTVPDGATLRIDALAGQRFPEK